MRDRKKGGRGGRKQGKEFMDAALDAYRRHLALHKWRQVMDAQASVGVTPEQAIREAGRFPGLGAYRNVWERWWDEQVTSSVHAETPLLQRVEAAVSGRSMRRSRRGVNAATRRSRTACPTGCSSTRPWIVFWKRNPAAWKKCEWSAACFGTTTWCSFDRRITACS